MSSLPWFPLAVNLPQPESSGQPENDFSALRPEEKTLVFPSPTCLIGLDWESIDPSLDLPDEKGLRIYGYLTYTINGVSQKIPAGIRIQGAGSSNNEVLNLNLFHYGSVSEDDHHDGKQWVKIGNTPAARKLMFKSEAADGTLSRDYICFGLYDKIVRSRKTVPRYEVYNAFYNKEGSPEYMDYGARGFPFWWPCVLTVKGEFYSMGLLAFQKDYYNYNIPKNDGDSDSILIRVDGGDDWNEVIDDGKVGDIVQKRNPGSEWGEKQEENTVRMLETTLLSVEDFKKEYQSVFDKQNLIDYLIFMEVILDTDGANEVMFLTFDGKKWFALPWDKDATLGLIGSGPGNTNKYDSKPDYNMIINGGADSKSGGYDYPKRKRFWKTIWEAFEDDIRSRYRELRENGVITYATFEQLAHEVSSAYPKRLWELHADKWGETLRKGDTGQLASNTSTGVILKWVYDRLKHLDKEFLDEVLDP